MTLFQSLRRKLLIVAAGTLPALAWANFPNQPIRLVVPFPAGGSTDLVARVIAQELKDVLGQNVVVENRAGAGSLIGSEFVANAPADGYTVLMAGLTNVFLPYAHANLRFHPVDAFAPVGLVADLPNVLAVNSKTPYRTLDDLIAADKAKPGSLTFGSAGLATPSHLVCEMVNFQAKIKLEHIPYKGNAPAVNDLMAGHIPTMCNNLGGTLPYMNSGQIRILAQTGKSRSASAPDVPTFSELGIQGLDTGLWMGLMVPKATPRDVVTTLNAALTKVMNSAATKSKLAALGATTLNPNLAAFDERIQADRRSWDAVLKVVDLKASPR
jgi:tripartite-type tricarboxylate transporter receptor subunit TctC